MRKIATCLATLALILSAGTASAETDFDALLSELDFGGNPSAQTLTLDDSAADALAPAPTPEPAADAPAPVAPPITMPESFPAPVAPVYAPAASNCDAIVSTGCDAGRAAPGCAGQGFGTGCNGQCGGQYGGRCGGQCGHNGDCNGFNCVPHTPPNLPTSTLRQYWKADACNSRVWDGFQNRCLGSSKHSRGECDCFDPSKKKSLFGGRGCAPSGPVVYPAGAIRCDSNSGKCLQLPGVWGKRGDCAGQAGCAAPAIGCDTTGCDS